MTFIIIPFILLLKFFAAKYCSRKAAELNRNVTGWGLFGFLSPLIAYFLINALSARQANHSDTSNQPIDRL